MNQSSQTHADAETQPGVHPSCSVAHSAVIHPTATLHEDVTVEHGAVVGPRCVIGSRTRLRAHAVIVQDTTLGTGNDVHPFAVLGGDPQDRAYNPDTPGGLVIGDSNIFREHVTISRGTHPHPDTTIGHRNMFMAYAHAGHNARVGNDNTLANSAALAGHAHIGNRNTLSSNTGVHQFTTVGDLTMFRSGAGVGMHTPPYVMLRGENAVVGLNSVGLARSPDITDEQASEVKRVFRIIYRTRDGAPLAQTVRELLAEQPTGPALKFLRFIADALEEQNPRRRRGIVGYERRRV